MDFVCDNSSFVDADLFLDPFFFWLPPVGVLLAFGRKDETVDDCVKRLDRDEPFRVFYACSGGGSSHPVSACYSRVFGKFISAPPPVTVGPHLDAQSPSPPRLTPVSPPGSPTSAVLDALRQRRSSGSPDADPSADAADEPCVDSVSLDVQADDSVAPS